MSIISGFNKVKNYVKTAEGYKLLSRWTSSDTVDVNGKTLTETVDELKKTSQDNGYGEVAGGKNLATVSSFNTPNNEISFIKKDDSTLIANGSGYTEGIGLTKTFLAKAGIQYTAQVITDLEVNMFIWDADNNSNASSLSSNKVITFSLNEDTHISVAIEGNNLVFANSEIKIQLEEGSVATSYEPYFPSNKILAEETSKQSTEMMDIKMLGWSVPRDCPIQNEVTGNQFTQKVVRVDLGSLAYTYDSNTIQFYSDVMSSLPQESKWNYNLYCNKYPTGSTSSDSYIASYGGRIYIRDKNYTDASAFKQVMQGQYLYYELANYNTMTIDGNELGETVSDVRKDLQ